MHGHFCFCMVVFHAFFMVSKTSPAAEDLRQVSLLVELLWVSS